MILTYKYRIKDSTSKQKLEKLASAVNFTWNYINDLSFRYLKQHSKFLSEFDINKYLIGAAEELGLNSTSLQEISKFYVRSRKTFKKAKLSWRSAKKRTLGWVPFRAAAIKLVSPDAIRYKDLIFRFYKSRSLPEGAQIKTGSFNQDSRGRWYLNLVCEVPEMTYQAPQTEVGIDLGIKNQLTLSTGQTYSRENIFKAYEQKLAAAQRANKKKLVKTISAKIQNIRKDWAHKVTAEIAKQFSNIYLGNLVSSEILTEVNKINRSIYDSGFYQIKSFLTYKTVKFGGQLKLIDEAYTTQICASCGEKTGPKGKEDLNIREWGCPCGAHHDRDQNSAQNILRIGHYSP